MSVYKIEEINKDATRLPNMDIISGNYYPVNTIEITSHYINLDSKDTAVFLAKVLSASKRHKDVVLKDGDSGVILWDSNMPDRGDNCIQALKAGELKDGFISNKTTSVDIAIPINIPNTPGYSGGSYSYLITAYCHTKTDKNENNKVRTVIAIDEEKNGWDIAFTEEEILTIQDLLDEKLHDIEFYTDDLDDIEGEDRI